MHYINLRLTYLLTYYMDSMTASQFCFVYASTLDSLLSPASDGVNVIINFLSIKNLLMKIQVL